MSKRSKEKRITPASRALRFLREQGKLSYRQAQKASGVNMAIINHLENGSIAIHQRHLEKLLPAYGANMKSFEMFTAGGVYPTMLAAIGDVAHPSWRASAVGIYRFWRDLGYAVGAIVAGITADAFGVPTAIFLVGVVTFLSGLVVYCRFENGGVNLKK